ncbi:hypothetical protein D8B29_09655, partial [Verminephrobacter eiseniae]|nr:hypothetical protein [Verminephrobacter eiseniae]
PSERSARRIAQPIPSVLASDATPRCASMASADRQMIGDATLARRVNAALRPASGAMVCCRRRACAVPARTESSGHAAEAPAVAGAKPPPICTAVSAGIRPHQGQSSVLSGLSGPRSIRPTPPQCPATQGHTGPQTCCDDTTKETNLGLGTLAALQQRRYGFAASHLLVYGGVAPCIGATAGLFQEQGERDGGGLAG